jgi:hypothetical protein
MFFVLCLLFIKLFAMAVYIACKMLRNLMFGSLIVLLLIGCSSPKKMVDRTKEKPDTQIRKEAQIDTAGKFAKIVFDSSAYHFGTMKQGELMHREIYFTNQGPGDLLIELISACECTTLDWSRLPIKPGSKSAIKIIYNSKDKDGPQIVDIDMTANTNPASTFTKFYLLVEK